MMQIDLNCDMGESTGLHPYSLEKDLAIMEQVSSVNLACGFHAGDAHTMHHLVEAALARNVAIGAHPAFPDRENFGRSNMHLSPGQVYDIILYQIGSLQAFLQVYHARLHHIKAHGALYNMAAADPSLAGAICNAVRDYDPALMVYGLSGSELIRAAEEKGLQAISETFADRTYQDDGSLTPRTQPGALIEEAGQSLQQVLQMVQEGIVSTLSGKTISIRAQTICIHGDGPHALPFAALIRKTLQQHHVAIQQP